jgi:hypothetical protein
MSATQLLGGMTILDEFSAEYLALAIRNPLSIAEVIPDPNTRDFPSRVFAL